MLVLRIDFAQFDGTKIFSEMLGLQNKLAQNPVDPTSYAGYTRGEAWRLDGKRHCKGLCALHGKA